MPTKLRGYINPKVKEAYLNNPPSYLLRATKEEIDIRADEGWQGTNDYTITIDDVVRYYAGQANSFSGCRSLGAITGDWRQIDRLAKECLEIFKIVNVEALRRRSRKRGLEPKF